MLDSDCTLCSIPFTISRLSNVCWNEKWAYDGVLGLSTGRTHVIVPYQDRYRACDCLQWKEHIE